MPDRALQVLEFGRVLEFVVAVREFKSGPEDLETLRCPGIVVAQPGERPQGGRKPGHDRGDPSPETGFDEP